MSVNNYIGEVINGYEIIELISGNGAVGNVYKAVDSNNNYVALKILNETYSSNQKVRDLFLQEAEIQKELGKAFHFVLCKEHFLYENTIVLVLEYLSGKTLEYIIDNGGTDEKNALIWAAEILTALEYAHSNEVFHRDIKPANILFNDTKRAYIGDFGIAQLKSNCYNEKSGTPPYMPPEQFRGMTTCQTDIYAFGMTWYELLTGILPFTNSADNELTKEEVLNPNPFPLVENQGKKVSANLAAIINKCIEKIPENRFKNIEDVKIAINRVLSSTKLDEPDEIPPPPPPEPDPSVGGGKQSKEFDPSKWNFKFFKMKLYINGFFHSDYLLPVNQKYWIGRDKDNHLFITSDYVSGKHLCLIPGENGVWKVYDNNSSNGTYINGYILEKNCYYDVNSGQIIQLCKNVDIKIELC